VSSYDDPDVRPYWGEQSEPAGVVPPREQPEPVRRTIDDRRQWKIAEGICPRPACNTELDEGACPRCGWSLVEERMRDRLRAREEPEPDAEWLPTLPLALQIDCFGPANIDDLGGAA
jgi:hypothetical protein